MIKHYRNHMGTLFYKAECTKVYDYEYLCETRIYRIIIYNYIHSHTILNLKHALYSFLLTPTHFDTCLEFFLLSNYRSGGLGIQ